MKAFFDEFLSTRKRFYAKTNLQKLFLVTVILAVFVSPASASKTNPINNTARSNKPAATVTLPALPFIANQGQLDKNIAYYTRTFSGGVAVTSKGELVYSFPAKEGKNGKAITVIKETIGGKPKAIIARERTATTINSYVGRDRSRWRSDIPTYNTVSLGEVYEGIELQLQARGNNVEKLFRLKSGADPRAICITVEGAEAVTVDNAGALAITTPLGPIHFTKPLAYQLTDGKKQDVDVRYAVKGNNYGFALGDYDKSREVIIDPLLASTYLGGSNSDIITQIATDEDGNVFVTGYTMSDDLFNYATVNYRGWFDIFVAKFKPDLSTYLVFTYIGGQYDDHGEDMALALDNDGDVETVYVVGRTDSADIPATGYDTSHNGTTDLYLAMLSPGLQLFESTLLGAGGGDLGRAVAVDSGGNVFVAGSTSSLDLPIVLGTTPYDDSFNGGWDNFVAKFPADLSNLDIITYLGGSESEDVSAMIIDQTGAVQLTGYTLSTDFPGAAGTYEGDRDVFIAKMSWGLTSLQAAVYFGGSDEEYVEAMTMDPAGNTLIAGRTLSTDLPSTLTAFKGETDAFVAKYTSALKLITCVYLGGSRVDQAFAIATDPLGNVFVAGDTYSTDFPVTTGAHSDELSSSTFDVFITKLPSDLYPVSISTYLGGISDDHGSALTMDRNGNVLVAGQTNSSDFPTTSEAFDQTYQHYDAFITKLNAVLGQRVSIFPLSHDFETEDIIIGVDSKEFILTNISNDTLPIKDIWLSKTTDFDWAVTCTDC